MCRPGLTLVFKINTSSQVDLKMRTFLAFLTNENISIGEGLGVRGITVGANDLLSFIIISVFLNVLSYRV